MQLKNRIIAVAAVAALTIATVLGSLLGMDGAEDEGRVSLFGSRDTIYFWYTDETLTDYINSAAVSFSNAENVRIIPVLKSDREYLEKINDASLEDSQAPDAYVLSNDSLEKAYLSGLAGEINDVEGICSSTHFPQTALSAVEYRGKMVGYPFYYETVVLVYNETYLEMWAGQQEEYPDKLIPQNMSDILDIADTFDLPENVEGVMKWDVSDIFYNYWFVGNYMIVGGDAGDDAGRIDIENEKTSQCLDFYKSLNQFFSMESDNVNYEDVVQDFIDGKIVFTIATSDIIETLEDAKENGEFDFEYGVACMPDVTDELSGRSVSVTDAVVINGYSAHRDIANRFAAYLVKDFADSLYTWSKKVSACSDTKQKHPALEIFMEEYNESVPLPKMMSTGNFWMKLEMMFSKVWNGGDVAVELSNLAQSMTVM